MADFSDLTINFLTNYPWLTGLTLAALLAMSVWLYQKTNPPLPIYLKLLLTALRIMAVVALGLALFEPLISYSLDTQRSRRGVILVDYSSSMDREEKGMARRARVDSILASPDFQTLGEKADLRTYYFGKGTDKNRDIVDRDLTAAGDAIASLKAEELTNPSDFWIMFSDGSFNSGRDARQEIKGLAPPLVAIDLSSEAETFDASLQEITFDPVVFSQQPTGIDVSMSWHNGVGKKLKVRLKDAERILTEKIHTIDQSDGLTELSLDYTPGEPGQKILSVELEPLDGEENLENNRRSISVKILKSRVLVLLYSSRPDYEVGFLKRYLENSERYDVELVLAGKKSGNLSGNFPASQTELNRYDLIVLHDPDSRALTSRGEIIKSYLADRGGAVWVTMGENFASSGTAKWLNDLLPFYPAANGRPLYGDYYGEPVEGQLLHPSVRLADDQKTIRQLWSESPPFTLQLPCDNIDPSATVLVNSSRAIGGERLPILGYRRHGPGKIMALAAAPIWKWGFTAPAYVSNSGAYSRFIDGTLEWLTVSEDLDPIRVLPEKEVFTRGEEIRFNGFAFDLGFRPIPDVSGQVTITREGSPESYEIDLIAQGEGKHTATFENIPPGRYSYEAIIENDGNLLKKSSGKISIESYSLEAFDQQNSAENLRAIARLTSGSYLPYQEFGQILSKVDLARAHEKRKAEVVVWGQGWLLLIILGALSIEWLIRKINQML